MGLLNEARREFIAAPDSSKGQIVFKWPDQNIRKFARAIVEPDAVAVFMNQGQVMGVLSPGQHTLDASEIPFLGMFVDWASNSNPSRPRSTSSARGNTRTAASAAGSTRSRTRRPA
jgi:membrane protease subunit (stomatin/prohibitin family)